MRSLHVFIISWSGQHANSLRIAHALANHVDRLTIVYSDPVPGFRLDAPCQVIERPNDRFWGDKFTTCLENCGTDLMLIIHGDTECDNWPDLVCRCRDSFRTNARIGIWSPQIDYTWFDVAKTYIKHVAGTSLNVVAQTDGIVFALNGSVMARLRQLDYRDNIYGWGIGWAAIAYAYTHHLLAVVDIGTTVKHPRASGYDSRQAMVQMHSFLTQLSRGERLCYRFLDGYIMRRATPPKTIGRRILERLGYLAVRGIIAK